MPDAVLEVQKALYAAASAAVSPIKVFDTWGAAAGEAMPYVCLETYMERDARTRTENDKDVWARLHVWSDRNSRAEAASLKGLLIDAIDEAALSVSGFTLNWCLYEETTSADDPGGANQLIVGFKLNVTPA